MSQVRQFMDVLTSEHLGALVKRPDLIGGKPEFEHQLIQTPRLVTCALF